MLSSKEKYFHLLLSLLLGSLCVANEVVATEEVQNEEPHPPLTEEEKTNIDNLIHFIENSHVPIYKQLTPAQEKENEAYEAGNHLPLHISTKYLLTTYYHGDPLDGKALRYLTPKLFEEKDRKFARLERLISLGIVSLPALFTTSFADPKQPPKNLLIYLMEIIGNEEAFNALFDLLITLIAPPHKEEAAKRVYITSQIETYNVRKKFTILIFETLQQKLSLVSNNTPKLDHILTKIKNNPIIIYHANRQLPLVNACRLSLENPHRYIWTRLNQIMQGNSKLKNLFEVDILYELQGLSKALLKVWDIEELNQENITMMAKANDLSKIMQIIEEQKNKPLTQEEALQSMLPITDNYPHPFTNQIIDQTLQSMIQIIETYRNKGDGADDDDRKQAITALNYLHTNYPKNKQKELHKKCNSLTRFLTLCDYFPLFKDYLVPSPQRSATYQNIYQIESKKFIPEEISIKKILAKNGRAVDNIATLVNSFLNPAKSQPDPTPYPWQILHLLETLRTPQNPLSNVLAHQKKIYFFTKKKPILALKNYLQNKAISLNSNTSFLTHLYTYHHVNPHCWRSITQGYTLLVHYKLQQMQAKKEALFTTCNYLPDEILNIIFFYHEEDQNWDQTLPAINVSLQSSKKIPDTLSTLALPNPTLPLLLVKNNKLTPHSFLLFDITKDPSIFLRLAQSHSDNLTYLLAWYVCGYDPIIDTSLENIKKELTTEEIRERWEIKTLHMQVLADQHQWLPNPTPNMPSFAEKSEGKITVILERIKKLKEAYEKLNLNEEFLKEALTYKNKKGEDLLLSTASPNCSYQNFENTVKIFQHQKISLFERYNKPNALHPLLENIFASNFAQYPIEKQKKKYELLKTIITTEEDSAAFYNKILTHFYNPFSKQRYGQEVFRILPNTRGNFTAEWTTTFLDQLCQKALPHEEKKNALIAHFQAYWSTKDNEKILSPAFYKYLLRNPESAEKLTQPLSKENNAPLIITLLEKAFNIDWRITPSPSSPTLLHEFIRKDIFPLTMYFHQKCQTDQNFRKYITSSEERYAHHKLAKTTAEFHKMQDRIYNLFRYTTQHGTPRTLQYLRENHKEMKSLQDLRTPAEKENNIASLFEKWNQHGNRRKKEIAMVQYYNDQTLDFGITPIFLHKMELEEWITWENNPIYTYISSPYYKDLLYIFSHFNTANNAKAEERIQTLLQKKLTSTHKEHIIATLLTFSSFSQAATIGIKNNSEKNALAFIIEKLALDQINFFEIPFIYENASLLQKATQEKSNFPIFKYLMAYKPQIQTPYIVNTKKTFFSTQFRGLYREIEKIDAHAIETIYNYYKALQENNNYTIQNLKNIGLWQEKNWTASGIRALFEKQQEDEQFLGTLYSLGLLISYPNKEYFLNPFFLYSVAKYGTIQNIRTLFSNLTNPSSPFAEFPDLQISLPEFFGMYARAKGREDQEGKNITSYLRLAVPKELIKGNYNLKTKLKEQYHTSILQMKNSKPQKKPMGSNVLPLDDLEALSTNPPPMQIQTSKWWQQKTFYLPLSFLLILPTIILIFGYYYFHLLRLKKKEEKKQVNITPKKKKKRKKSRILQKKLRRRQRTKNNKKEFYI